jgi:hypothetical protein
MLYWLGVYALVVAGVLLALLLLYLVAAASWLALTTIHFMIQTVRNVSPRRTGLPRERWTMIHR